jgi:hypothetical protein
MSFDLKTSTFLIITFIIMTVIGTLSHELGHYSMAKLLGYEAKINYGSSHFWGKEVDYIREVNGQYSYQIKNGIDFPEKESYLKYCEIYWSNQFWITLGGPLQTMASGSIGLVLLLIYRKRLIINERVSVLGWVFVFMSLFWLRQVANLANAFFRYLINGNLSHLGDEVRLALHLHINPWTIQIITGILGLLVLFFVLKTLPRKIVPAFLLFGFIGGISGYYFWLIKFGPIIMP